jgi:LuxR family quorum sensing-dependent transcriptional regulator
LEALQRVSHRHPQRICVFGIWHIPPPADDHFDTLRHDRTMFFHPDFPGVQFWTEYHAAAIEHGGSALADYGRSASHPFTLSEAMRVLRLTGEQRWIFDLLLSFGVRDGLYCPFRRWIVLYRAKGIIQLDHLDRQLLFMAAGAAVQQMERLAKKAQRDAEKSFVDLTDREIAVLRLLSYGHKEDKVAAQLKIGTETVRTHVKKAIGKLKARNRSHAIAQAIRLGLLR